MPELRLEFRFLWLQSPCFFHFILLTWLRSFYSKCDNNINNNNKIVFFFPLLMILSYKILRWPKSSLGFFMLWKNLTKHFGQLSISIGLPRWLSGKESACQCRTCRRHLFNPWFGKIPWRRNWQHTPVFLPGKSHGQRGLAGNSQQGHKKSDKI